MKETLSTEELNKLRKPAKKFIVKEDIRCEEKNRINLYENEYTINNV